VARFLKRKKKPVCFLLVSQIKIYIFFISSKINTKKKNRMQYNTTSFSQFHYFEYKIICPNCGNQDENEFEHQRPPNDNFFVCCQCGTCDLDPMDFAQTNEESTCISDGKPLDLPERPVSVVQERRKESSYQRKAHLMERLSQSLCREPLISDEHLNLIQHQFDNLCKRDKKFRKTYEENCLSKRHVQRILRSLNEEHNTKIFTTRYLEKWQSIKQFLYKNKKTENNSTDQNNMTPSSSSSFKELQAIKLGTKFNLFSNRWDELKRMGMFPERKHFPNFNFMFVQIANLFKIPINVDDFPQPSLKCQQKLKPYFEYLAKDLNFLSK
jgi:hypothetical protein